MTDNMKKFLEAASADAGLQDEMKKLNQDFVESMLGLVGKHGLELTIEDLKDCLMMEGASSRTLSPEEMEAVSGGEFARGIASGYIRSWCRCVGWGSGDADEYQNKCICVAGGFGTLTETGKEHLWTGNRKIVAGCGSDSAPVAMWCAFIGNGADV